MVLSFHTTPQMLQNFSCLSQYSLPCSTFSSRSLLDPPVQSPLAMKEQLSSRPRHPAHRPLFTHAVYYCTSYRLCSTHWRRIWVSPCDLLLTTHLPCPDKANFLLSYKTVLLSPPLDTLLSGIFVLWLSSALLFLASLKRVPEAFPGHAPLTGLTAAGIINSWDA